MLRQRRPPPLFLGPLRRPRSIDTFRLSVAVAAFAAAVPPPVSVPISAVVFFTALVEVFVTIPGVVRRRGMPRAGSGTKRRTPRVPLLTSCLGYLEEDEEPSDLYKYVHNLRIEASKFLQNLDKTKKARVVTQEGQSWEIMDAQTQGASGLDS